MEIMALVGASGTGKSHRALVVAHEHNIDTIIDDGCTTSYLWSKSKYYFEQHLLKEYYHLK